ncbi:MAG TPA: hypothetical protein VHW02_10070 [Rhizomicrobium sp.]|jgi:hypothetical protein|nr:hypothetical protein [Rhizomicrobium sp.]
MVRHFIFLFVVLTLPFWVAQSAVAQDNPNPPFENCVGDTSLPPENIVSSCTTYINEAYMQDWGMQYVPTALYRMALAYQREGKTSQAEKTAIRAAKMAPEYLPPWRLLVVLADNVPESDADMKAIDVMIAANPHSTPVLNSACWERAVRGQQLDAAVADCSEAIRLDPANAQCF